MVTVQVSPAVTVPPRVSVFVVPARSGTVADAAGSSPAWPESKSVTLKAQLLGRNVSVTLPEAANAPVSQ